MAPVQIYVQEPVLSKIVAGLYSKEIKQVLYLKTYKQFYFFTLAHTTAFISGSSSVSFLLCALAFISDIGKGIGVMERHVTIVGRSLGTSPRSKLNTVI